MSDQYHHGGAELQHTEHGAHRYDYADQHRIRQLPVHVRQRSWRSYDVHQYRITDSGRYTSRLITALSPLSVGFAVAGCVTSSPEVREGS